ncbi:MAG TPA: type II toxin-antitoxin system RelB/DinJ family antitoxin [Candidatus Paceibacterota bacterium]|mgnify:FL=1|jgi:DNA-damage-inducible protein J|nr:type II toxin-antitoxin system RelB/DinJ family antitoxin [Candidatus Paceibacterota bacterium]
MATLNIRIEENLKNKAQKTFNNLGLDMSTAVKMFLHQSVKENALPFHPTNNPKLIKKVWDKEVREALKNGKSYKSAQDLFKDLDK